VSPLLRRGRHRWTRAGLHAEIRRLHEQCEGLTCQLVKLAGEVDTANAERDDVTTELNAARGEIRELRARVANLDPFHQAPVRPDEDTVPLDVRQWRAEFDGTDYLDRTRQGWKAGGPVIVRVTDARLPVGPAVITPAGLPHPAHT
jgi:hypothetical protein